jgi:tetratricopeptide (TPR) repeat protein
VEAPVFEISIEDGRGLLLLKPRTYFGWLTVDKLELVIPEVSFPLDITRGIKQFQGQRCRVAAARLSIDAAGAAAFIRDRTSLLSAAGFDQVRAHFRDGRVEIGASARVGGLEADLSAHATLEPAGYGLRVELSEAFTYGFLRRPAPLCAHDLLCVLFAASPASDGEESDAAVVSGLGQVLLHPLALLLQRLLPAAGWRLPDLSGVRLTRAALDGGRAELHYGAQGTPAEESGDPDDLLAAAELSAADELLLRNDLSGAAAAYREAMERTADGGRPLAARLLAILCARDGSLGEAESVARAVLQRWPDFLPAELALAAVALARRRSDDADRHLEHAIEIGGAAGHVEVAVRAALIAARHIGDRDPPRAARLYERALRHRPDESQASTALASLYERMGRWRELERLLAARAAFTSDPREQATLKLRIGELLLGKLGDPTGACTAIAEATRLDENDPRAWDLLARAWLELDERRPAVEALERLAAVLSIRGDTVGQSRVEARAARLHEELGELEQAWLGYRRSLALVPEDPEALQSAAQLAVRRGDLDTAIAYLRALIGQLVAHPERRRLAVHELLTLLARTGDIAGAHLLIAEEGEPAPEIRIVLAAKEEAAGELDAAVESLRLAAERVEPVGAAGLELERARILRRLERQGEEVAALEAARRLAPSAAAGFAAARRLAELARKAGDAHREAACLDVLLAGPPGPDVAELQLRRAQLHLAEGEAARARMLVEELRAGGRDDRTVQRLHADVLGALGDSLGRAGLLEALAADSEPVEKVLLLVDAATSRIAGGELGAAHAPLRAAQALAPDDPMVLAARADLAWHERAWDEVVSLCQLLLPTAQGQEQAEWARRLGVSLERLGRIPEALAAYHAAVEGDGEGEPLALSFRRLGELHQRMGDYPKAIAAYVAAGRDERTGEEDAARADQLREAAEIEHRRLGDHDAAIALLEEGLRRRPDHLASFDALEAIYSERGDDAAVAELLRRKLETGAAPEREEEWLERLAELDQKLGHRERARASFERALTRNPELMPALRFLAADALERGVLEEAEGYYLRLAAHGVVEDRRLAFARLIEIERSSGRLAELVETLARAAADAADGVERLRYQRDRVRVLWHELTDPAAALEACRVALVHAPDDPELLVLLCDAARASDAVTDLGEALSRRILLCRDDLERAELLAEAAELFRRRLAGPERAEQLGSALCSLPLPPERKLAIAERVSAPLALALYRGAAESLTGEPRIAALRKAANNAHAANDLDAERALLTELLATSAIHPPELTRLARLDPSHAAERYAEALARRTEELAARGDPLDAASRELLAHLDEAAHATGNFAALVDGLVRAARLTREISLASSWLRDAARLCRETLLDPAGASALLGEALELELTGLEGIDRLPALRELERCDEARGEPARAQGWHDEIQRLQAGEREHFERLLHEKPSHAEALSRLADLAIADGRIAEALPLLDRQSRVVETRAEQVAILFRMGELSLGPMADPVGAAESWLKAIDLDPNHVPTLRCLIDHFAASGDSKTVAELAADLDRTGALRVAATPLLTRARAALHCALADEEATATRIAQAIPEGAAALARALAEAALHVASPRSLVTAAKLLCRAPGPTLSQVRTALKERKGDSRAGQLAAMLG